MREQDYSLGMIETIGFPALVAASDAAAKAADVRIATYQGADAGIVTIYIVGDVASVQSAVATGEAEARKVGQLRHSHVIARPDKSVLQMVLQLLAKKEKNQPDRQPENTEESVGIAAKSVSELRKMARSAPQFPLTADEISVAKKEDLIRHLTELEQGRGVDQS